MMGRVFRRVHADDGVYLHDLRAHLRDIARRNRRHAVPGIVVTAALEPMTASPETVDDG